MPEKNISSPEFRKATTVEIKNEQNWVKSSALFKLSKIQSEVP